MAELVQTTLGAVRGLANGSTRAFLGIPYAASPVGARRFAAPQPLERSADEIDATEFSPSCPQPPSPLPGMAPGPVDEASCLNLNVFTPAADGAKRPVLFWIHGGAFTSGSGRQAMYDGSRLAARGDVVVVTINYRLGALGFLCPDPVGASDGSASDGSGSAAAAASTNVGILDQIAALRWVRENIEAFGGDPGNVTIFGESAGGMSVTTLMATPAARGLFHKAIPQSGAAQATLSPEQSAEATRRLVAALGHAAFSLDALRAVPVEELLEAQIAITESLQVDRLLAWAPVVDGVHLPEHPLESLRAGHAADIPLLVGSTADEWRLFTIAAPGHREMDEETLRKRLRSRVEAGGADIEAVLTHYAAPSPCEVFDAVETDRIFRLPATRLAEVQRSHQPATFMYRFSWPSPVARGALGACHAVELPFVFGTLDVPGMDRFSGKGPAADALSAQVMDAWIAFARLGDPGHADLPAWAPFELTARTTMDFAAECRALERPDEERRLLWAEQTD